MFESTMHNQMEIYVNGGWTAISHSGSITRASFSDAYTWAEVYRNAFIYILGNPHIRTRTRSRKSGKGFTSAIRRTAESLRGPGRALRVAGPGPCFHRRSRSPPTKDPKPGPHGMEVLARRTSTLAFIVIGLPDMRTHHASAVRGRCNADGRLPPSCIIGWGSMRE